MFKSSYQNTILKFDIKWICIEINTKQIFLVDKELLKTSPEQTGCDRDRTLSLILEIATDKVSYLTADQAMVVQLKV